MQQRAAAFAAANSEQLLLCRMLTCSCLPPPAMPLPLRPRCRACQPARCSNAAESLSFSEEKKTLYVCWKICSLLHGILCLPNIASYVALTLQATEEMCIIHVQPGLEVWRELKCNPSKAFWPCLCMMCEIFNYNVWPIGLWCMCVYEPCVLTACLTCMLYVCM